MPHYEFMAERRGGALLSAIVALIVAASAAWWYAGLPAGGRPAASDGTAPGKNGGAAAPAAPAAAGVWTGTWSASPVSGEPGTETDGMAGRTVRNVVHTSVGGVLARITLSNLFGTADLTVTHATIALAADRRTGEERTGGERPAGGRGAAAALGTMRRVTFGGSPEVVVPAGGEVVSDAVALTVPYDSDVLVSVYAPGGAGPVTHHPLARQTGYVAEGERTADLSGAAYAADGDRWRWLTALDVYGRQAQGTLVAFGDSITDGVTATRDADHRWPDVLADRLREAAREGADVPRYGVVNAGVGGNRVLTDVQAAPLKNPSALHRFDRDVLSRPNVRVVVVDLGINDILRGPAAPEAILAGLRTLVDRAHAHGVKVIGSTLTPFLGHRGHTAQREAVRQHINEEIRGGGVYDAVVDFDEALRDPSDPRRLLPEYDSGDHLHPGDEGYRAMAGLLDLRELRAPAPARLAA